MEYFILVLVLAALTVGHEAASVSNESAPVFKAVVEFPEGVNEYTKIYDHLEEATSMLEPRDNLILFYEESFFLDGIPNTVQHRDVFYRANSTTYITRISVISFTNIFPQGYFKMRQTYAHVRLTSAPGDKLYNTVQFYGHYTDWP
ncbi:hypothetical protein PYW08_009255 [Mythimna loreyi]|uniref:Uncharacterized protein n=1 Tax=Mythimna loreyi TaxID=667449 RepID=A0ACC2Q9X1_9NEOP|nr:hypothetical protein PYW08_009255 [Mythimna loreyi]